MDLFSAIIKKYSLYFPHLPLPTIIENEGSYNVFIFDMEIEITEANELEIFIDQVIKKMAILYEEKQKPFFQSVTTVENKNTLSKSKASVKEYKRRPSRNHDGRNQESKIQNSKLLDSKIQNSKLRDNKIQENITKSIENNIKNNVKSARGKMKIKNIQSNRYVPTFSEDISENKNNILTEPAELFSDKITSYCHSRNIAYPEYVFEKSNGVFLCRAFFMKEKFESRYAYDMVAAREDASSLIYSYIKFQETDDVKKKCTNVTKEEGKPVVPRNTNYSDIYNNTEKDDTFDIGSFFSI